jgi:hypothetical protein
MILNRHILALDVTSFVATFAERRGTEASSAAAALISFFVRSPVANPYARRAPFRSGDLFLSRAGSGRRPAAA